MALQANEKGLVPLKFLRGWRNMPRGVVAGVSPGEAQFLVNQGVATESLDQEVEGFVPAWAERYNERSGPATERSPRPGGTPLEVPEDFDQLPETTRIAYANKISESVVEDVGTADEIIAAYGEDWGFGPPVATLNRRGRPGLAERAQKDVEANLPSSRVTGTRLTTTMEGIGKDGGVPPGTRIGPVGGSPRAEREAQEGSGMTSDSKSQAAEGEGEGEGEGETATRRRRRSTE